jgi:hypothetical protein
MPYIEKQYREELDKEIERLAEKIKKYNQDHIVWPGLLNYAITKLILKTIPSLRYWTMSLITGILENVKQEFYRRIVSPYEDQKKEKEGDVYNED